MMRLLAALAVLSIGLPWSMRVLAERLALTRMAAPDVVRIDGGFFAMGSDDADVLHAVELCAQDVEDRALCRPELFLDEQPLHRVYVSGFRIDRSEVSQRAYARCVERGVCAPSRVQDTDARLGLPDHPAAGVTAAEAQRYCGWLGGRLPTEAEWERAARGGSRRRFPWGQLWNGRVANHGQRTAAEDGYEYAAPVDALPDGKSAYGLLQMAGNVWELTADRYDRDAYAKAAAVDPQGPLEGEEIVIRGGSWRSPIHALRASQRAAIKVGEARPDVGFRCAYNVR
jgi:formylglycine-generating enzyme